MEKVSILMPNYNHETQLKEAIESCLAQSYKNIELIIVDSSTDNSMEIIEKYKDDERVSIYHRNDSSWSLPQKLNFLVEKANGDYIKFAWSDDILMKDCIKKNINFAKKYDLDFVNIDMSWINYEGKEIRKSINKELFKIKNNLVSENPGKHLNYFVKFGARGPFAIGPNSLFAKKKSLKKIGKFNENFIQEDVPFVYKMYTKKFKIGYINEPLWRFRVFDKVNTSDLQGQSNREHFKMRIYCMNLAIKSGLLDKTTLKIDKKRIGTYKAEIFQSNHKLFGLFWLFFKRYRLLLVKYSLVLKNKKFSFANYARFIISDFHRRVKMVLRGRRTPHGYY